MQKKRPTYEALFLDQTWREVEVNSLVFYLIPKHLVTAWRIHGEGRAR